MNDKNMIRLGKNTTMLSDKTDVRSIVTADAPYAGDVSRIPQDIQERARQLCWKYNIADPSDTAAQCAILRELLGSWRENVVIMPLPDSVSANSIPCEDSCSSSLGRRLSSFC